MNHRTDLLAKAERIVNGDRNAQYGDPRQDFQRTATMWSAYLGVELQPHDVAALMAMLKLSRIRWSPEKKDSWVDLAGYAACGWDCVAPDFDDFVEDSTDDQPALDLDAPDAPEVEVVADEPATTSRHLAPVVDPHICPHCGDVLPSRRGLSVHVGLKHKVEKRSFDPQKARDAAAAAL